MELGADEPEYGRPITPPPLPPFPGRQGSRDSSRRGSGEPGLPGVLGSLSDRLELLLGSRLDRIDARLERIEEHLVGPPLGLGPTAGVGLAGTLGTTGSSSPCGASGSGAVSTAMAAFTSIVGNSSPTSPVCARAYTSESSFSGLTPAGRQPGRMTTGTAKSKSLKADEMPSRFPMREEWSAETDGAGDITAAGPVSREAKALEDYLDDEEEAFVTMDNSCFGSPHSGIILPTSRFRLFWDISSVALIMHDMIVLPLILAFRVDEGYFFLVMFWISLLFWTFDICVSFNSAFYHKGSVEVRRCQIVLVYLRTWFILDAAIVTFDWLSVVLGSGGHPERTGLALIRMGKTLRLLRVARALRLLRLIKLRKIIEEVQDRITSEYFHIMIGIVKLLVCILALNHWIACAFWAVSAGTDEVDPSWVRLGGYIEREVEYQYFTALHWSLTQFTPSSMEVQPKNIRERVFAVAVIMFALIIFSSFVSSITAAMTSLRRLSSIFDKNFSILRRYLRDRGVTTELSVRIMRYAEHQVNTRRMSIQESDVALLQLLSKPLHMELLKQTYAPTLTNHPFFRIYSEADPIAMQSLCTTALTRVSLSVGDALFTEASSADRSFFCMGGRLRYFPRKARNARGDERTKTRIRTGNDEELTFKKSTTSLKCAVDNLVEEGDWFCEAALWTPAWAHVGSMRAVRMTEVVAIDAAAFARVTRAHQRVGPAAARYGRAFVKSLNELCGEGPASTLSDMPWATEGELEQMAREAFEVFRSRQSASGDDSDAAQGAASSAWAAARRLRTVIRPWKENTASPVVPTSAWERSPF